MRLRNKKTDAIVELVRIEITDDRWIRLDCRQRNGVEHCMFYRSLVELNDEWMDYTPRKPLIKDKKLRKAVRAWAEANEISQAQFDRYTSGFSASDDGHNLLSMISFDGFVFMFVDGKYYTIEELCGDDEE